MIVIRKVDIRHVPIQQAIKTMHEECYRPVDNPFIPTKGDWWVAFKGKEAVAFAGIRPASSVPFGGYLCRAGVLPGYRGQGPQQRLLRKRVAFARER